MYHPGLHRRPDSSAIRPETPRDRVSADTRQRDTVEFVPTYVAAFWSVTALPILGGSDIELEREAALGEVVRHVARLHTERESLARSLQRREQILRADKRLRPGENVA